MFVLLPLPWLLRRLLRAAEPGQALHLPHPGLHLAATEREGRGGWRLWLLLLAWLCLLVAAARPQWVGPPQAQQRSGRALMLAVDLSGSMRTDDMQLGGRSVSRFGAVEAIAGDFISRRGGDELGLILFGSRAYLVTPLTYDLDAVRAQLQGAAVGLAGTETAIGDAIAVAVKRLAHLPAQARVVVLLTDGVNNAGNIAPLDAANAAKAAGVRVFFNDTAATEMNIPDLFGTHTINPSADLDEGMLRTIAGQTGGRYFRATDASQLTDAYRAIDALEPMHQQGPSLRPRHELFRWPLALSVLAWLATILPRVRRLEVVA